MRHLEDIEVVYGLHQNHTLCLGSLVVMTSARHAEDPSSILGRGASTLFSGVLYKIIKLRMTYH